MALTIDDDSITSDGSAHTAHRAPGNGNRWEVSWLPGRRLDRNSAITAMILADVTTRGDVHPGDRNWIFVEGWAAELGLTAPDVLARTVGEPQERSEGALPADPEAAG